MKDKNNSNDHQKRISQNYQKCMDGDNVAPESSRTMITESFGEDNDNHVNENSERNQIIPNSN